MCLKHVKVEKPSHLIKPNPASRTGVGLKPETVARNVEKSLKATFGNVLKDINVDVREEAPKKFKIKVTFEVGEGEVKGGGEVRNAKPGKYEVEAVVTIEEGEKLDKVHFEGKCGEASLVDTYYVEKKKASEVPGWIGDKVATVALNCSTEVAEQADVGGLFGW